MGYSEFTIPQKCLVLETVFWSKSEKVLRVQLERPLRPEPFREKEPIKELLLSLANPDQSLADIGREIVMVNMLIPLPPAQSPEYAPIRIEIGTLHKTFEDALEHSPLEKEERQKWVDGTLNEQERQKWLDGLM